MCSVKKVFLEILLNPYLCKKKYLCQSLFFNKVAGLRPTTLLKRNLAQVFSCEFCKIFKNTFSYRTPPVAASVVKPVTMEIK